MIFNKQLLSIICCLIGLSFIEGTITEDTIQATALANTKFTVDLLKQVNRDNNNVFFSPYSISAAVAMISLGASANTLTEIESAFHFSDINSENTAALHEVYKGVVEAYNQTDDNCTLTTANRLFAHHNFDVKQEFQNDIQHYYYGGLQKLDFTSGEAEGIINTWVEDQTNGKIKDLLGPNSLNQGAALVLINAIHFKGIWKTEFDSELTEAETFYVHPNQNTSVQMMFESSMFPYKHARDDHVKVLELPYAGDKLSMFVILPDRKFGLQEFLDTLTGSKLEEVISNLQPCEVKVFLPKFKLETQYSLVDNFKKLGITEMFSERANLSRISDYPLQVSDIFHKAFIELDEEGTEAAAATGAIVYVRSGGDSEFPKFKVDHPALLLIREKTTGFILFCGTLYNPS